jgi:hypothetical protein
MAGTGQPADFIGRDPVVPAIPLGDGVPSQAGPAGQARG